MPPQIAATPAPAAQGTGVKFAQLGGSRRLHSEPFPKTERTDADLAAWSSHAVDAGIRLSRAAMAWNRAIVCQHPESIGFSFERIDSAKGEIDALVSRALCAGPSQELLAAAIPEYHAQRGTAASVAPTMPARQRRPPTSSRGGASEATTRERQRLHRAHPDAFDHGARSGFLGDVAGEREAGGYPSSFNTWAPERRDAWFSGFNAGRLDRVRAAEGAEG